MQSQGVDARPYERHATNQTARFGGRDNLVTGSDVNPLLSEFEDARPRVTPYNKKTKATIVYKEVVREEKPESSFESKRFQYENSKYPMKGRLQLLKEQGQTGRNS